MLFTAKYVFLHWMTPSFSEKKGGDITFWKNEARFFAHFSNFKKCYLRPFAFLQKYWFQLIDEISENMMYLKL